MSIAPAYEKLVALLAQSDDAATSHELAKAATILKEASHLYPDNDEVKRRWVTLHDRDGGQGGEGVIKALQKYAAGGSDGDGREAVRTLQHQPLSPSEARQAYLLLCQAQDSLPLLDELMGTLLDRNVDARRFVASELGSNAANAFARALNMGDASFQVLVRIPLDDVLWSSRSDQVRAQQDLFRFCVMTLRKPNARQAKPLMMAVARQLTIQPNTVIDLIDETVFSVVLSQLDVRLSKDEGSQALLATSRLLEVTKERGAGFFESFVTSRASKQTDDDLILAFSVAAAVFPILPGLTTKLFLTDGFIQQLVLNLEKSSTGPTPGTRQNTVLEHAALKLLSAACVNKACRNAINTHCSSWLRKILRDREDEPKALAALILAKSIESPADEVAQKLFGLILRDGQETMDQAIEGLAYTSLQPKIKEEIISNMPLLKSLLSALKERQTCIFGCLTIFFNISTYRVIQSEEQKKMSQLKAYANASKPTSEDSLDNDKHVAARCKILLDNDIVPAFVTCCKRNTSPTNFVLVANILLAMSKEQKHRAKMTQQGSVKLLLQIRERANKTDHASSEAVLIKRSTAHTLARLLISVNPAHVFSAALPAISAVSALVPLLSENEGSEQRDLLPTFEALLALTNLASMDDSTARDLVIRSSFEKIEDLLFSSNTLVQRASVELVCNLMAAPTCVAKFADGSNDAKRRMQILLALTDVDDLAARKAAGGAVAMLTEWDAAVSAVLEAKDGRGVKAVLDMCADADEEVKHRGMACAVNLVNTPGDVASRVTASLKEAGAVRVLKEALRKTRNPEILGLGVEVLKKLS